MHALLPNRGRYADASFANFDPERELPGPAVWKGGHYDEQTGRWRNIVAQVDRQREMLYEAKARMEAYAAEPHGWVWLQGNYGSGKTHLAVAVANALAEINYSTHYDTIPGLLELLRAGIEDHSIDDRAKMLAEVDLLVLDDLGTDTVSAWAEGKLGVLLNARYNFNRRTVITSNVPLGSIDGRMASRCSEMCEVITLVAFDIRKVK